MAAHSCETCGMLHDTPTQQESPEVAIARIQAESALAIEKLRARTSRDFNETSVEVAEIEGEAQVATAEAEAEVIGEILAGDPEPEGEPIVVEAPEPEPEPEPEPDNAPPVVEVHEPKSSKRGGGWWDGYS